MHDYIYFRVLGHYYWPVAAAAVFHLICKGTNNISHLILASGHCARIRL